MPANPIRHTRAYQIWRAAVRKRTDINVWQCIRCGGPIDPRTPYKDPTTGRINPLSWTADHITPIAKGGAPYDIHNGAGAHHHCNSSHGAKGRPNRPTLGQPLPTSRNW